MSNDFTQFVAHVQRRRPRFAIVLGSGLGDLANRLGDVDGLPFDAIPGMAVPSVEGHRGSLRVGTWIGQAVLVFAGRLHYYEGHPWCRVLRPIHMASELGVQALLITNAAGGIRADLGAGDLMAIIGHCAWTDSQAWRRHGSRFANACSPRLLERLRRAADDAGVVLKAGTYAQVTGPSYETPAEIRALRALGVDAVGMSTARELEAAAGLGLECAAISCITNKAAGLGVGPIHHEEVLAAAATQRDRLAGLIEHFLQTEI